MLSEEGQISKQAQNMEVLSSSRINSSVGEKENMKEAIKHMLTQIYLHLKNKGTICCN